MERDSVRKFLDEVSNELCKDAWTSPLYLEKNLKMTEVDGVVMVSFGNTPSISVCCKLDVFLPNTVGVGFWELILTQDILMHHITDELGLSFNDNLHEFGPYFGKALKEKISMIDNSGEDFTEIPNELTLGLTYNLGGREYVGLLKVPLLQQNLNESILRAYHACVTAGLPPKEKIERVLNPDLLVFNEGKDTKNKAAKKKRKVGGIDLFPTRKTGSSKIAK